MHALRLTTRFEQEGYQGEACLLVYDEQLLSGTMLSEDVRDLFESRPATARIYILAPFVAEIDVRACLVEGALFARVSSYFPLAMHGLFLLTFRAYEGKTVVCAIPFSADESERDEHQRLCAEMQNGWLFDLFDRYRGRLDAPLGVHFGKSSGKHTNKFLRASGVLLSSGACAAIAFFTLGSVDNAQPKRIFVDTAPLIAIAFAIQRIAKKYAIWELEAPITSFSSYGGMNSLPDSSGKDLILVSASTSGSLVDKLKAFGFNENHIATLFFLESSIPSETLGAVICDLTFKPNKFFGYPPIESHLADECPLCKAGYFLAELEGDQFLLEKRATKRLMVKRATQSVDARDALEVLTRTSLLQVRLFNQHSTACNFVVNADELLNNTPAIRAKIIRALRRYVPMPLDYVVLVGIHINTFNTIIKEAGINNFVGAAKVVPHIDLSKIEAVPNGGVLVLFGQLDDFACARDINAQLRTIVPKGCVFYLSSLTIANSAEHLSDLKMFLTFGEEGKNTFTYDAACSLMLPARGDEISPWESELQLLLQLKDEQEIPSELVVRLEILNAQAERNTSLFWPGNQGELEIKNDFVYLDTSENSKEISQADIFGAVSNLLASVRADNRGLNAAVQLGKQPVQWHQSVYGHAQLDPGNFEIYNDAVLRAAFLRAASSAELQYFSDVDSSSRMFSVIQALILGWEQGGGECLPEFLVSMATKRLSLTPNHMASLRDILGASSLPPYLVILSTKI